MSQRIGSILKTIAGVSKHEISQQNIVNITFDDQITSADGIMAILKKNDLTVAGKPLLIQ